MSQSRMLTNFILGGVGNCEYVNVFLLFYYYSLGAKIVVALHYNMLRIIS